MKKSDTSGASVGTDEAKASVKSNGHPPGRSEIAPAELRGILASLQTMRDGDFSVRLAGRVDRTCWKNRGHIQRYRGGKRTDGAGVEARRPSGRQGRQHQGTHALARAARSLGRDGSIDQHAGRGLAAPDGGSDSRNCGRRARQFDANGAHRRGRAAAGRRIFAVGNNRQHHDSAVGSFHR